MAKLKAYPKGSTDFVEWTLSPEADGNLIARQVAEADSTSRLSFPTETGRVRLSPSDWAALEIKDPDSAQFRNEEAKADTDEGLKWVVTGEVNANNSFGGKVGYTAYLCTATYDATDESTQGRATILGD